MEKNSTLRAIVVSLMYGGVALILAYLTVGFQPLPGQYSAIIFAVYMFLALDSIAAGNGKRSFVALWLTLACGVAYLYGLLCKPTYQDVSPASVMSAGFVIGSAIIALQRGGEFPAFTLGKWYRMFIIFPLALLGANWIADNFPYRSAELFSFGTALGIVAILLDHLSLALYDWGKLEPGSWKLRVPAIAGGLIMLWYYQAFGSDYHFPVVFNATLVIDNVLNILVDVLRYKRTQSPS